MECLRCKLDKGSDFSLKRATGLVSQFCRPCEKRMNAIQWGKKHPDKKSAHYHVAKALKDGKITRPSVCSWCGKEGYTVAHHRTYKRVLNVEWICDRCHRNHHLSGNGERPLRRNRTIAPDPAPVEPVGVLEPGMCIHKREAKFCIHCKIAARIAAERKR